MPLVLSGCDRPAQEETGRALGLVNTFYSHLIKQDFEKTVPLLAQRTRETFTPQGWVKKMAAHQEKLGALKKVQFKKAESNTIFQGRFYILSFYTHYENANAFETFSVYKDLRTDSIEIVKYDVEVDPGE